MFAFNGKNTTAATASLELFIGPMPAGQVAVRTCGTPHCVNPDHLRPGTRKQAGENRAGASKRNRSSGVRGVTWDKNRKTWKAHVGHDRKVINVGRFASIAEAEAAVIAKRLELHAYSFIDTRHS